MIRTPQEPKGPARLRSVLRLRAQAGALGRGAAHGLDEDLVRRRLVREHVVPLLSEALADEPATYEVLVEAVGGAATERASLRAEP